MINIKKNGVVTNSGPDQEWLQRHIAMGSFGRNAESFQELITSAILAEDGTELESAIYATVWNPAEYVIEEVDDSIITQDQINQEAREYLASTDWYVERWIETGVAVPTDVTTKRAAARAAVVDT